MDAGVGPVAYEIEVPTTVHMDTTRLYRNVGCLKALTGERGLVDMLPVARHGGDDPVGGNLPDPVIPGVREIDVPFPVYGDTEGVVDHGARGRTSVPGVTHRIRNTRIPPSGDR